MDIMRMTEQGSGRENGTKGERKAKEKEEIKLLLGKVGEKRIGKEGRDSYT